MRCRRQLIGMGTETRVLEPESLRELVKAELHGVLSYYSEPIESHQEQPVRDNNEFLILFTLILGGRLCILIQTIPIWTKPGA